MSTILKDPICGMVVDEHKVGTSYEGIHYDFCSKQRLRFESNPHLYSKETSYKLRPETYKVLNNILATMLIS